MKIKIKNYNGIKEIEYEIEDKKINFLFGISGSGKSSIATALSDPILNNHIRVGESLENVLVEVDNTNVRYEDCYIFDSNYMSNVLINKSKEEDIYNILFGDGGKIIKCKEDYLNEIGFLLPLKEKIYNKIGCIESLVSDLKIDYLQDGVQYKKTCIIRKMEENFTKVPKIKIATTYSSGQIKWLSDGKKMDAYLLGKCPFCGRKLTEKQKEKLDKLIIFDAKTYEKINSESNIFCDLDIQQPDWNKKRDIEAFNKKIKKYVLVKDELIVLRKFISYLDNFDYVVNTNVETVKPSNTLKELFPDIYAKFNELNLKIKNIKAKIGKLKEETNKLISSNVKVINEKLELIGIPYKFVKKEMNENSKKAQFIIKHNNQTNETNDMTNNLSFGEKNIIGLILFLLANKDKKMLIIDDPASSFDEYRRKVIFDFIYSLHSDSTVLILSHDHVFAKFAILHFNSSKKEMAKQNPCLSEIKRKYYNDTGKINYLENYDNCKLMDITEDDFISLQKCIKDQLLQLGNQIDYRTALNLRLYYELEQASKYKKLIYGYLSAILHKCEYASIIAYIEKENKTEEDILKVIKDDLAIEYSPLQQNYLENINVDCFTSFERVLYCRELIKTNSKSGRIIKDELSNIIHLNSAYAICLNPYKFNYFSKYVFDYITNNFNINL